ncbi:MAG: hypothetical protein KIT31_09205 [Deltaproteobacteria bacterium]|nr:hypothetical protein [Deltaproteobacteria bacterium]
MAAALVAVALWEIVASIRDARAVPDDDAWREAAQIVRAQHRPGDLIVFAPAWADPVGRLHLGDLIPVDMAARVDDVRYARIWELAIRGAHAPEVAAMTPVLEDRRGGVTVRLYEREPAVVLADVRELLAGARWEGGGGRVELAEVGFAPKKCIQVTPSVSAPARVTFPRLPLGRTLYGGVGIADVFTRRDERSAIHLDILVDGVPRTTVVAGVDDGWVRFAIPTEPGAADVTFVASAAGPNKLVCFAAEALR